jgi:hypothetical protein
MVNIKVVIALATIHRHFNWRFCFLSPCFFCSITREPSLHLSLLGSTLMSGIPSARQKANESSA